MEKMLVAVFDSEAKAYEAARALAGLDADGAVAVHALAVIKRNPDGTATVKESGEAFPAESVAGTAVGALIGLVEGPAGLAAGTAPGPLAGMVRDLHAAGVGAEFVDDAAALLAPGRFAVIADISEEWVTPLDSRLDALGAAVMRAVRLAGDPDQSAGHAAALREEIDQLQAEYGQARGGRRARLKARINQLEAGLQRRLDQAREIYERRKQETEAKIRALRRKAERTQGEIQTTLNARLARIQRDGEASEAAVRQLPAERMRAEAERFEK